MDRRNGQEKKNKVGSGLEEYAESTYESLIEQIISADRLQLRLNLTLATKKDMDYGISSRDYFARAKRCLEKDDIENLFYAAFEIRCGVEARMEEYLDAQEHISKKKRQGWRVAKLAKNIESVFRLGEKDAILRILNKDTKEVEFEARYTPVKKSLRKRAEKFGSFLHSSKKYHPPNDAFWDRFREDLESAIEELERATLGRLLGPLLLHPNKKHIYMKLEIPTDEERDIVTKFKVGTESILEVIYE